jgi:hypothetical protein
MLDIFQTTVTSPRQNVLRFLAAESKTLTFGNAELSRIADYRRRIAAQGLQPISQPEDEEPWLTAPN